MGKDRLDLNEQWAAFRENKKKQPGHTCSHAVMVSYDRCFPVRRLFKECNKMRWYVIR
jgi:hypothetical protein